MREQEKNEVYQVIQTRYPFELDIDEDDVKLAVQSAENHLQTQSPSTGKTRDRNG